MVVWLASWPRSGNTLLRLIIQRCFDIPTYSIYNEDELADIFGEHIKGFNEGWSRERYEELQAEEKLYCVKTHQLVDDPSPIIYVVRDGRDAHVSLSHFWKTPIFDLVKARAFKVDKGEMASWSDHVQHFSGMLSRNGGIKIKYEEMRLYPDLVADAISTLLKSEPLRKFANNFAELQKENKELFRKGQIGDWVDEFTAKDEEKFWLKHGDAMRFLGYA